VPHVELSVSEPHVARQRPHVEPSLDRWAAAVAGAAEPCLVIDHRAVVVAMSAALEDVLGLTEPPVGRRLLGGVLKLLDFADGDVLTDVEVGKIPPLLALSSSQLARGLLRVRCADGNCTFDAIATPLGEGDRVTGSLTFLIPV
jgi:hypothetical protein